MEQSVVHAALAVPAGNRYRSAVTVKPDGCLDRHLIEDARFLAVQLIRLKRRVPAEQVDVLELTVSDVTVEALRGPAHQVMQVSFVRQEAQFLVHFTQYRLQVFTGAEMPCCTDVNATRLHLLAVRPPPEKYQSIAVDDPQMERVVPLAPRVHHSPGEYLTGRLAVLVQH